MRQAELRVCVPGHPGHGPQWNLTRKAGGRTRMVHWRPGPELDKARREVAEHERLRELIGQVAYVNEAICQASAVVRATQARIPLPGREGKRGAAGRARGGAGRRARTSSPPRPPGPWAAAMPAWKRRRRCSGPGCCGWARAYWSSWLAADRGHRGPRVRAAGGTRPCLSPTGASSSTRCSARSP